MFSLRDTLKVNSLGIEEDSFGWWIGVETQGADESCRAETTACSESTASCGGSEEDEGPMEEPEPRDLSSVPSDLTRAVSDLSRDPSDLGRGLSELTHSSSDDANCPENIELASIDGVQRLDSGFDEERHQQRLALCYTPERLVKTDEFRILPPSPRCCPDQLPPIDYPRIVDEPDKRVGAAYLKTLLLSKPHESCQNCFQVRYGDGEVLLRDNAYNNTLRVPQYPRFQPYSDCDSRCDINSRVDDDEFCTRESQLDLADDTSGVSSVDGPAGTRGDDWSSTADEELDRPFSSGLSDVVPRTILRHIISAHEKQRKPSAVESILSQLEREPKRVEALLLEEDRYATSGHDSPSKLALAIEPDATTGADDEAAFELLRSRVDRLQHSSKLLTGQVATLRKDFTKDEMKVNHLSEDVKTLRNEVRELRYLDDLLDLLKGELERISDRNWPFVIGHTKQGIEEINLVV